MNVYYKNGYLLGNLSQCCWPKGQGDKEIFNIVLWLDCVGENFSDSATTELLKPSLKQTEHGADVEKQDNQYIVKPFPPSPGVSDKSGKNPIHLVCDTGNKARL